MRKYTDNKEILEKILKNKEDYFIWIADDHVFAEDRIEKTTDTFTVCGNEMIKFLFDYLGFDAIVPWIYCND